jgi:uncharacterized membrane protein
MRPFIIVVCLVCILCSCSNSPLFFQAPFDGYTSEIDVSSLKPRQPQFYSLSVDGKKISFFIVKVNEEIQSYFNACRECHPEKRGFRFEEGYVKCRSCNERWPLDSLRYGIGNCYPIPLKGVLRGKKYVITRQALLEGTTFF